MFSVASFALRWRRSCVTLSGCCCAYASEYQANAGTWNSYCVLWPWKARRQLLSYSVWPWSATYSSAAAPFVSFNVPITWSRNQSVYRIELS